MASSSGDFLEELVQKVRGHDSGDRAAEVVTAALLDRAGNECSSGERGVADKLADEAGISDEARDELGDPFLLLERDAKSAQEVALLEACLGLGLSKRIEAPEKKKERRKLLAGLLAELDSMEASTPISPYRALAAALAGEHSDLVWDEIASDLIRRTEKVPSDDVSKAARGRLLLLARAAALEFAPGGAKAVLAAKLVADLPAGAVKRVALSALAGVDDAESRSSRQPPRENTASVRAAAAARAPRLEGELEGKPWSPAIRLLAAATGVLLIRWLARLVGRYLLGWRSRGTVSLGANTVKLERKVFLLGKEIRAAETAFALRSVRSGAVEVRLPFLHLLVGALCLVMGAAIGLNFIIEGSCASYPPLALIGFAFIGGGLLLDILLEVLLPAREGVCTVYVDMGRTGIRLRGVDGSRAAELTATLDQLLPPPRRSK